MSVRGQLLAMLEQVAEALGDDLRGRLAFVGGCTTAFYVTDAATLEGVRATDDVDLVVDLTGYGAWVRLQDALRARGFQVSAEDDVICRMRLGALKVDFMPDDPAVLGFSNRWYGLGMATAIDQPLNDRLTIRLFTAPLFLATKLEAWLGRGGGDMVMSRDLEDVLLVVDGRPALVDEVRAAEPDVRAFVAGEIAAIMQGRDFDHLLEDNIRGPEGRTDIVYRRLAQLAASADDHGL